MDIDWYTLRRGLFGDDTIGEILFRWACQGIGVLLSIGWIIQDGGGGLYEWPR